MKNIWLILCILSFIITAACLITVLPKRRAQEKSIKFFLLFASLVPLSYIFVLSAQNAYQARIAYSFKSLFFTWMLAFLLLYSIEFISKYFGKNIEKNKENKIISYGVKFILVINSLIIISNMFTPHVMEIVQWSFTGDMFYMVKPLAPYYFHVFVVCTLVLLNCLFFYRSSLTVSRVYWQRYKAISAAFFIALIINLILMVMKFYVDISVLFYWIFAYHIRTSIFSSSRLLSEINSLLIESYANGILVFDSKDLLAVYNKRSVEIFSLSDDMLKKTSLEEFAERNHLQPYLKQNGGGRLFLLF